MITFVAKKQSFEADDGHTDDLVMSLVLFAWLTRQEYFKSLTDLDVRTDIYEKKITEGMTVSCDDLGKGFFLKENYIKK